MFQNTEFYTRLIKVHMRNTLTRKVQITTFNVQPNWISRNLEIYNFAGKFKNCQLIYLQFYLLRVISNQFFWKILSNFISYKIFCRLFYIYYSWTLDSKLKQVIIGCSHLSILRNQQISYTSTEPEKSLPKTFTKKY